MNTVVVIGQGYVGLPMALRAAQVGHSVTGLELNETVVENLNRGVSHIGDIGEAELSNALSKGYIASPTRLASNGPMWWWSVFRRPWVQVVARIWVQ